MIGESQNIEYNKSKPHKTDETKLGSARFRVGESEAHFLVSSSTRFLGCLRSL